MPFLIAQAGSGIVRDSHYAYSNQLAGRVKTLLLQGASTNLLLQSQSLNVTWSASGSTITAGLNSPVGTAPDGTLGTVAKIADLATSGVPHVAVQSVTKAASAIQYTLSAYVTAGEYSEVVITLDNGTISNGSAAWFNLATGVKGTIGSGGFYTAPFTSLSSGIEPLGNGWFRVWLTATTDTAVTVRAVLGSSTGDGVITYAGTAGQGAYWFGAQLEALPAPTSYILTTTVAVARNADVLTFPFTPVPQAMSIYDKYIAQLPPNATAGQAGDQTVVGMVNAAGANGLELESSTLAAAGVSTLVAQSNIASAAASASTVNVAYNIGDTIERLLTISATGVVTLTVSINGGAPVVGAAGAAGGLQAAFSAAQVSLSANQNASNMAYQNIHIELGVQTLAYMRTAAGQ